MTAREIIEKLKKMPEDAEVRVMEESEDWEHPITCVVEEAGEVRIEFREDDEE